MTDRYADTSVLVVDDEEELADIYATWLDQRGFDVEAVYSGEAALSRLHPAIDVLLLDRRMPNLPGDAVLEAARERAGSYQVSMITAIEPDSEIVDLPFDEYLTKPVTRTDVVGVVEDLAVRDSIAADLQELFQMASKQGTLPAESVDADGERDNLGTDVDEKRREINEKLRELDDPQAAFSVIE